MSTEKTPETRNALAILKPGQASAARWTAYILAALLVGMGVRSLFATFNRPGEGVLAPGLPVVGDLTWIKIICVSVFILGMYAVHRAFNRERSVDLLIETEQELRKVSWPSGRDVKSATLVVSIVTVVMGAILFWADWLLERGLRFVLGS
jgi:preprotein translocase SecE subunit